MSPRQIRISKFLSLVLPHELSRAGLVLDRQGWAEIDKLLAGCAVAGLPITREELAAVVADNDKKRFAFSEDGRRIRASQGHSVGVDLGYAPEAPPELLFHGTTERFLSSIRMDGLEKRNRQHVHLSGDPVTAIAVGQLIIPCGFIASSPIS